MRTLLPLVLCAVCAGGCEASPAAPTSTGRAEQRIIVGANELSAVAPDGSNLPRALAPSLDAVGRMEGIACTGTHVGHNLVLTAAHCLMAEAEDECNDTAIEWGVRGDQTSGVVGHCIYVHFAEFTPVRDLALIEVDQAPAAQLELDVCHGHGPGDAVQLLGHPDRAPLHWSGRCILDSSSEPLGRGRAAHSCDTQGGSSGSPLLDWDTLAVIGVHIGGAGALNQASLLFTVPEPFALQGWDCGCDTP